MKKQEHELLNLIRTRSTGWIQFPQNIYWAFTVYVWTTKVNKFKSLKMHSTQGRETCTKITRMQGGGGRWDNTDMIRVPQGTEEGTTYLTERIRKGILEEVAFEKGHLGFWRHLLEVWEEHVRIWWSSLTWFTRPSQGGGLAPYFLSGVPSEHFLSSLWSSHAGPSQFPLPSLQPYDFYIGCSLCLEYSFHHLLT